MTSRPEGIVDPDKYADSFVMMNLLPLTSEQQVERRRLAAVTRSRLAWSGRLNEWAALPDDEAARAASGKRQRTAS